MVGEEHLGMKFEMFQFVNLDADVLHNPHSPDGFYEFFLFELMRRTGHEVDLHSAARRPDQSLDNNRILVTLILKKDGILRVVNKLRDAVSTVAAAPDQVGVLVALKGLSLPVRFEALDYFSHFMCIRSDNGVITGFGQVFRFPVQGFHECRRIIHHH